MRARAWGLPVVEPMMTPKRGSAGMEAGSMPAWSSAIFAAWQANEDWIRHRLILTPHSAFFTPESMRDNRGFASRTAARYLRDGRLENCVNKQFLVPRT